LIADVETADGIGYSKKESHQKAAEKALKIIEEDADFQNKLLDTITNRDDTEIDKEEITEPKQSVDLK
jgi:ribonuclease-3